MYCNTPGRLDRLTKLIESILQKPHKWQKPHVFLCCEGRNLGRVGGRLGLVELGVDEEIFLLDVLTYSKALDVLKEILENDEIDKIMWDGRNAVAELDHGHEISIESPIDLQLVQVHEKAGGNPRIRGFVPIEHMDAAFLDLSEEVHTGTGMDMHAYKRRPTQSLRSLTIGRDEIRRKEQNDKDYWLRRPLSISALDYSSFKIVQLRSLYANFLTAISKYPYIEVESQRYVEIYTDERPPPNVWFIDHDILPQEILERSPETHARYDQLGTRVCAGCRRPLHQDSFRDSFARRWTLRLGEHGRLCYTCQEARRLSDMARTVQSRWRQD